MSSIDNALHIALDLDDTVLAFVPGVCEAVSRDFGVNVKPEDVTDWDFGQFIDQHIGRDWWAWLEDHAWLWGEKFKPVPGAIGGIEKLRAAGHYIEIVTAKPAWAEDQIWVWLARYKPRVHQVTIVPQEHISNKSEVTNADLLVDDRWDNVLDFIHDDREAILFKAGHNSLHTPFDEDWPDKLVKANDWHDVLESVELLTQMGGMC